MANFQKPVAEAVYSVLSADVAVTSLVTGIYSYVPQDTAYPYVVIEDASSRDLSTMGLDGGSFVVTIATWSRYHGIDEVSAIMDAIYNALHKTALNITTLDLATSMFSSSGIIREADGKTWRGVQRFEVTLME